MSDVKLPTEDIRIGYVMPVIPPSPEQRLALAYCKRCEEYFREWVLVAEGDDNSAYQYDFCSKCSGGNDESQPK